MSVSWPEHLIFVGSGATASLGFKTTWSLGDYLNNILEGEYHLAFQGASDQDITYATSLLNNMEKDNLFHDVYNFNALKLCMRRVKIEGNVPLMALYNFIDMHITSDMGLVIDGEIIRQDDFIQARRLLSNLILYRHQLDYYEMLENKQKEYKIYQEFALFLGKKMQEEGICYKSSELRRRDFYLFSYGIISMNWDPVFLWILFNAHKELNSKPPYIGNPARPLKLFHDFSHPMYMRKITNKKYEEDTWFPMNEGAAYRLNDTRGEGKEFIRLGKFYFPHGSHVFRKCGNCGKLNIYLGDEWKYGSNTLYPPSIFQKEVKHRVYSIKEEQARKHSKDALICVHCDEITHTYHTDMVMQTSFKGNHSAYLEEVQRDMRVAVEKSNHIILLGYSLPNDDVIYTSMLAAKHHKNKKISIIGAGNKEITPERWVYGSDEIEKLFSTKDAVYQTYLNICNLFDNNNIRIYSGRIPEVFADNERFSEEKASEILEWK